MFRLCLLRFCFNILLVVQFIYLLNMNGAHLTVAAEMTCYRDFNTFVSVQLSCSLYLLKYVQCLSQVKDTKLQVGQFLALQLLTLMH